VKYLVGEMTGKTTESVHCAITGPLGELSSYHYWYRPTGDGKL